MRTLYLLRHAKSSLGDASLRDFDRPLTDHGREAAKEVGMRLKLEKLNEPLVICSPAVRARETAEIVLQSAELHADERFDERIYEASLRDLLQVVAKIPDEKQIAILIGHNPGLEELSAFLTGESRRMPACALVKIQLEIESWKDLSAADYAD
jgi:phosphohistidine phosphatase